MSEANKKQLSAAAQELVSSLMQATPDMLEALAEYAQLPQGVWLCTLKTSTEAVILKDPDVPYIRIEATIDDILGIADDVDELDIPKLGSICSELFNLSESVGQGMMRRRLENLKAIMERPDGTSNADILNDANGLQIKIITGPFRKADNGNNYTSIKGYAPAD
jgi:hypothetical protein